jgi:hypothetical protein
MKQILFTLVALAGLALFGLTGCSKSGGGIDTSKVESAFQTVSQADKAELQNALTAIKSGDYAGALASLQKAAANVKLTPEQQQSLKDLVAQVQSKLTEGAKKVVDDAAKAVKEGAEKAASDAQKAINK